MASRERDHFDSATPSYMKVNGFHTCIGGGYFAPDNGRTSRRSGAMEVSMTAIKKLRADETALRSARMLIGGNWVESASGEVLEVEDPAHRRSIAEVPRG